MSHEPLVTITLEEYNSLIIYKDRVINEYQKRCETMRHGIRQEWEDIVESHELSFNGELFTYTRMITKDSEPQKEQII